MNNCKNPIPSQFDILLEQGKITVDFLLCRDSGGDTYSFMYMFQLTKEEWNILKSQIATAKLSEYTAALGYAACY